jgi:NADH dehydrogenase
VVNLSFLRARPGTGSPYHETKWKSEQIVAASGLQFTNLEAGVIFGAGDGMITNMWRAIRLAPVFATVGFHQPTLRPVWVGDIVEILSAAATSDVLANGTVAALGPEELQLGEAARRVAAARGSPILVFPLPLWFHYTLGWVAEHVMPRPLVSVAQVKMLAEGVSDPQPGTGMLPPELRPRTRFDREHILESMRSPQA